MFARQLVLALTLSGLLIVLGCGSSEPSKKDKEDIAAGGCTEPENPYSAGTGHYAGYEWAEKHGSGDCNSSSTSFNEGCEEYESQEIEYQDCESRKNQ
jgi:hypothetical protein